MLRLSSPLILCLRDVVSLNLSRVGCLKLRLSSLLILCLRDVVSLVLTKVLMPNAQILTISLVFCLLLVETMN